MKIKNKLKIAREKDKKVVRIVEKIKSVCTKE